MPKKLFTLPFLVIKGRYEDTSPPVSVPGQTILYFGKEDGKILTSSDGKPYEPLDQQIRDGITIDEDGVIHGIGTADIKVDNESAFADDRFTTVQLHSTNGNAAFGFFDGGLLKEDNAPSAIKNSSISVDDDGRLQGIGTGAGAAVSNSKITIDENGHLVGIGTPNIKVNNDSVFEDERFTAVAAGTGSASAFFQDGLLKDSAIPGGLRNSNITVGADGLIMGIGEGSGTQVSNSKLSMTFDSGTGEITLNRGDGTFVKANPLQATIFASTKSAAESAASLSSSIESRFSSGKLSEEHLEAGTRTKLDAGAAAHDDLSSADISIDASGVIRFSPGGLRPPSSGAAITKGHVGLPDVENKDSATIRGEIFIGTDGILAGIGTPGIKVDNDRAFEDVRFTNVASNADSGLRAHNDLNDLDIFIESDGKIKVNRGGTRGSSLGANITKSHVGLPNAEDKSSETIRGEITIVDGILTGIGTTGKKVDNEAAFTDTRFTTVRDNAINGNSAFGFFDSGLLKDASTPSGLKNSNISIDADGAIQGIGSGAGTAISNGKITIDASGFLNGIGTSNIKVNNEAAFTDSRFTSVRDNAANGNSAFGFFDAGLLKDANTPSGLKNSNISLDATGAIQGIGSGTGTVISNSKITVDASGVLTGIGTPSIKVNNEAAFSDSRFTSVRDNAANGNSAFGFFDSGLLKDANTPSGLKNSNISIDAAGTIQGIGSGSGTAISNSKITIDASGTLTGIGTPSIKVNNEAAFSDSRFTGVQTNASLGAAAHSDLNSADISVDGSGNIKFNRGGSRGLSTGTTITKSTVGLSNVENKSSSTIRSEITVDAAGVLTGIGTTNIKVNNEAAFSDTRFTAVQSNASNALSTATTANTAASSASTAAAAANTLATTANTTANTVNGRFSSNGRIKEANSLNNATKFLAFGVDPSASPETNDKVTVSGTDGAVGTDLIYGTRVYSFSSIPNSSFTIGSLLNSSFSGGFTKGSTAAPVSTTTSSIYASSFLKSEFTVSLPTSAGIVRYAKSMSGSSFVNDDGFLSNTSATATLAFNNLFYGPVTIRITYNPVQVVAAAAGSYWSAVSYNGHTTSPPFFKLQSRPDTGDPLTGWVDTASGFLDKNAGNANLGTLISTTDGTKSASVKVIEKTENLTGFNQLRLMFDAVSGAAGKSFVIEEIQVTGWCRATDPDVLSKVYQLADGITGFAFTFTGQHKSVFTGDPATAQEGLIVSSQGTYDNVNLEVDEARRNTPTIDESVPTVALAASRNDKKVFGVISKPSTNSKYSNPLFPENGTKPAFSENRYEINSLGEGAIWVTNINGNLQNGDYITTCEIPGYGMRQDDDLLHNYTVAKITCDCDFDLNSPIYICEEFQFNNQTYRRAFVGCTYHCG